MTFFSAYFCFVYKLFEIIKENTRSVKDKIFKRKVLFFAVKGKISLAMSDIFIIRKNALSSQFKKVIRH